MKISSRFVAVVILIFLWTGSAHALKSVIDFKNLMENIKLVREAVKQTQQMKQQVETEIQELSYLVRQLETMQRNVERLVLVLEDPNLSNLQKTEALLITVEGLTYNIDDLADSFEQLYPVFDGPLDAVTLADHNRKWADQTRQNILKAMQMQGSIEQVPADRADVYNALDKSRSAVGNLQVQQAGNEISASIAKQLMRLEYIVAANGRAISTKMAEETSIEEARSARHNHLVRSWTNKSEVQPIRNFP